MAGKRKFQKGLEFQIETIKENRFLVAVSALYDVIYVPMSSFTVRQPPYVCQLSDNFTNCPRSSNPSRMLINLIIIMIVHNP
jgi:hypothetical protein